MTRTVAFVSLMIVLVVGCSHVPTPNEIAYVATVENVTTPEGAYFTTAEGSAPLNYVYLRLHNAGKPGDRVLQVQVLDRFDPKKYGRPGDVVSFRHVGTLPSNDSLPFEELKNYSVVSTAKAEK